MTDRNSDRDAIQPVGEGALVPDPALDQPADGQPTRQREVSHSGGNPDGSTDTDRTCVSCGAPVASSQRKCRFCLEHELDAASASGAASSEQTLRGVIHFLVESGTFYGAVAKGTAAATLLTSTHDEPITDCTLIYGLDDGDQLWIVPAVAVETVPRETESTSTGVEIPTVTALKCQHCTRETEHRFRTRESLPDET